MRAVPVMPTRDRVLDALRGLALVGMAIVDVAATEADPPAWLRHAAWDGIGPADLVFPLFLYAAGVALVRAAPGGGSVRPLPAARTIRLVVLGMLLGALPLGVLTDEGRWQWLSGSALRLPGVLQRIALTTLLAAILLRHGRRLAVPVALVTLVGYPLLLAAGGDFTLAGNLVGAVDRALLGPAHLLGVDGVAFDPEGLLSTWPATVTVLIGAGAAGVASGRRTAAALAARALLCGVAGGLLAPLVPLNKSLWSSSYVLVTGAAALLLHAGLVLIARHDRAGAVLGPLARAGRHSLILYVGTEAAIALLNAMPWGEDTVLHAFCAAFFTSWAGAGAGTLLFALAWAAGLLILARGLGPADDGPAAVSRFGDNGA